MALAGSITLRVSAGTYAPCNRFPRLSARSSCKPIEGLKEINMSNATEIANRYIALWNETDSGKRRALIAKAWTEDANYVDPLMKSEGHAEIDAMIAGVQQRFAGHHFT